MELVHEKLEKAGLVHFKGRLDAHTAAESEKQLTGWIEEGQGNWIYEFSELTYISSAGLRVLLTAVKKAKGQGGGIAIAGMQPSLKEIFEIAGFTSLFKEYNNVETATAAL